MYALARALLIPLASSIDLALVLVPPSLQNKLLVDVGAHTKIARDWRIPNSGPLLDAHHRECLALQGMLMQLQLPRGALLELINPSVEELLASDFDDKGRIAGTD
jgi:hypothetical protein